MLNDIVDKFVITEADTTFSGNSKPYFLDQRQDLLEKFGNKIIRHKVKEVPQTLTPFLRDRFQRDEVKKILTLNLKPEDILIYGDVDEIPDPSTLKKSIKLLNADREKFIHFAQDVYYIYLNQKEVSNTLKSYTGEYPFILRKKWLGTNISRWKYSRDFLPTDLRDPVHKKIGRRMRRGGWHFSYVGSATAMAPNERVLIKIQGAAHQEFNTDEYLHKLDERIELNIDIFKRKRAKYKIVNNLSYLPDFIRDNSDKYSYLIKQKTDLA